MKRAGMVALGFLIGLAALTPAYLLGAFDPIDPPDVQWGIRVVVAEQ